MPTTSVSLLDRLQRAPDTQSWQRLLQIYEPFIRRFLCDTALREDRDDLIQDVLGVLVQELPRFQRERVGSFRNWLRTVTVNRANEWWRKQKGRPAAAGGSDAALHFAQLEDPSSALSKQWETEHDQHVARRLLELVQRDFTPPVWSAFRRQVLDGAAAADVAAELNTSVNAILLAKSRVMKRIRDESAGLIE
jgi:RNA polymerase sigma-70 factor (ECF subfamily)